MISFLSKWIEGIAITVIIASIFEMILPNGNLKKYIKIILGIYIIFSIIAPFVDSKALYTIDIEEEMKKYTGTQNIQNNENIASDLNKIYANTFENEIKQTIEKKGFTVYKCMVEGVFDAQRKDAGIKNIKIILDSKNINNTEEISKTNTIENVNKIEKVEIKIGENQAQNLSNKITEKDIKNLKKYLSEHYEIEQKIIDIQVR